MGYEGLLPGFFLARPKDCSLRSDSILFYFRARSIIELFPFKQKQVTVT